MPSQLTIIAVGLRHAASRVADGRLRRSWRLTLAMASGLIMVSPTWAVHRRPCVNFDVADVAVCRPVTDSEQMRLAGDERLVEAEFVISSLIRLGQEPELTQFLYVIESPSGSLRVVDYDPKTEMETRVAGNVAVQKHAEKSANIGVNASAHPDGWISATGSAGLGSKATSSVKYELLPPHDLVAASGTVARGTAVYFKLRRSDRWSLDGAKSFRVVFRVPPSWRADYVRVRCVAYRQDERTAEGFRVCAQADYLVGLYQVEDSQALMHAREFVASERRLRQLARQQAEPRSGSSESLARRLKSLFRAEKRELPPNWLADVIHGDPRQNEFDFQQHLPGDLQSAVHRYAEHRQQLLELSLTP